MKLIDVKKKNAIKKVKNKYLLFKCILIIFLLFSYITIIKIFFNDKKRIISLFNAAKNIFKVFNKERYKIVGISYSNELYKKQIELLLLIDNCSIIFNFEHLINLKLY